MDFLDFCRQLGIKQPTQGAGHAYNYAQLISDVLEDGYGEQPPQCTVQNGACAITVQNDILPFGREALKRMLDTLVYADSLEIKRKEDEVEFTVVFRL